MLSPTLTDTSTVYATRRIKRVTGHYRYYLTRAGRDAIALADASLQNTPSFLLSPDQSAHSFKHSARKRLMFSWSSAVTTTVIDIVEQEFDAG